MKFTILLLASAIPALTAFAETSDPFPFPIAMGEVRTGLADFATIPDSDGAKARVNQLEVTPAGRIFVLDQRGPIYCLSADGASVVPYLDLHADPAMGLVSTSEAGLQSMAFHPDFNRRDRPGHGKFYTIHSCKTDARPPDFLPKEGDAFDSVLLEWHCANPAATAFAPADENQPWREVLRIRQPFGNHNTGLLAFNPNSGRDDPDYGKLYVAVGDGGSGGDPQNLAQDLTRIFGKILRIDPLGTGSQNGRYGIPNDNPFAGKEALPEIWAYGFRNPQRYHWDRGGRGQMFIADIGQNVVEEIDIGVAGGNYGWHEREGSFAFVHGKVGEEKRGDRATTGYIYPVAEYDHGEGNAITAGYVCRGANLPGLEGKFIFGDLARGRVFYIGTEPLPEGGQRPIRELRFRHGGTDMSFLDIIRTAVPDASRADLRFGSDAEGGIYLLNKQDGIVRKLVGQ